MKFSEIIDQAAALLQRKGRVSYRTLKIEFNLTDEHLDALKEELIDVEALAVDKDGKMLVWTGDRETPPSSQPATPSPQPPSTYTPHHLAERIETVKPKR